MTFYVITPSGSNVVPALQVVEALQSTSTQLGLQALGFTLLYLAPVNSVTTATASQTSTVSESPAADTGLLTAELVAIVCGSVGGIIVIIMIICVAYFV